jgi:hypothetical protein
MAEVGGFDKCDRDLFLGLLRGTIGNAAELQVGFAPSSTASSTSCRRSSAASC